MTDLKNGKIDVLGVEINPETTLEAFEAALGDKFEKICINPHNDPSPQLFEFRLNGKVGIYPDEFIPGVHTAFNLYGMSFVNVRVFFLKGQVRSIELVTDMDDYFVDEHGKLQYSDDRNALRFEAMNSWAINSFGEPSYQSKNAVLWNCGWGSFRPSPRSQPWGTNGSSIFYIEYGKEYNV